MPRPSVNVINQGGVVSTLKILSLALRGRGGEVNLDQLRVFTRTGERKLESDAVCHFRP